VICWKCRETVRSPICVSCNTIQPLQGKQDYFRLLGLPRTYFLALEEIAPLYRKSLRNLHPDRFVKKSAVERRMSLQWMAEINKAKKVISDPFTGDLFING
jgi:DnaJ-domain-containing protein 1